METTEYRIPAVALRGMVVLPEMVTHFDVSRSRSIKAVEQALSQKQNLFVVTQQDPDTDAPEQEDLFTYGTVVEIKQIVKMPHNILRVLVEGMFRARLVELETGEYLNAQVEESEPEDFGDLPLVGKEAMLRNLKEIFQTYCEGASRNSKELVRQVLDSRTLEDMITQVMVHAPFDWEKQQRLLEAQNLSACYEMLCITLNNEIEIEKFRRGIQEKVKARIDKNQKEYVLREQIKVIREELGETNVEDEADEFMEKLKNLKASDEVKEKLKKEISRFQTMGNQTPESSVLRTYIETMFEVPWEEMSEDSTDLDHAQQVLDRDHYGMEKVKERVLEYLAERAMSGKKDAAILCLVGPPGTGKTSIARSIAKATNKKYIRLSLGGVRDESEIRGHRKTYVGAMPGRIVEALKKVKVRNPLMLLDEIDKTGKDQRGDTASALLEVLDPEQNEHFTDHYLEVALNLSDVLFVATANDLSTIPRPLLDRMEIIEVSSYTENEKYHIANDYLVKKQMEANGLNNTQIHWKEDALRFLITDYTREAGVRNLERRIGQVSRKVTRDIYQKKHRKVTITKKVIKDYLGRPVYEWEKDTLRDHVGIVHGLAWTAVGGVTLKIEVNVMPGKGAIQVTGSLGNVMKESAQAAISYIRSQSRKYKIKQDFFEKHDIHIHIPEGAVPKDGPSAGITMTTAVLSAITGNKVCGNLAMTGEVTIRGDVLMIGGLKEKLLAAKRLGITKVLVPKSNEKDVKEFEEEVVEGLEIVYVKTMTQVIKEAFVH